GVQTCALPIFADSQVSGFTTTVPTRRHIPFHIGAIPEQLPLLILCHGSGEDDVGPGSKIPTIATPPWNLMPSGAGQRLNPVIPFAVHVAFDSVWDGDGFTGVLGRGLHAFASFRFTQEGQVANHPPNSSPGCFCLLAKCNEAGRVGKPINPPGVRNPRKSWAERSDFGARPQEFLVEYARSAASGLWVWSWPVHSEGQQQKQKRTGRSPANSRPRQRAPDTPWRRVCADPACSSEPGTTCHAHHGICCHSSEYDIHAPRGTRE